jgi:plastocyanin domain-containing protein
MGGSAAGNFAAARPADDASSPANASDPSASLATANNTGGQDIAQMRDGKQLVSSTLASGRYPDITVQAGTPVEWVINAPKGSINGCNNRMLIQAYGIEHAFEEGENVLAFMPQQAGTVRYTCWMGMIRGNIIVVAAENALLGQTDKGD